MKHHAWISRLSLLSGLALSTHAFAWTMTGDQAAAMALTPNLENGKRLYETCAVCHTPLAWGTPDGRYPQIAGQHPNVLIKQLLDIRNGNRDNPTMYPFTQPNILPDDQALADVVGYIAQLPMSPTAHPGSGMDISYGKRLYEENCVKCHGANGEGHNEEFYPRLQGQNYFYLKRQMLWIQNGQRRNADPTMVKQIHSFDSRDIDAVIDYASRLRPAPALVAKPNWRNPDFPAQFREPIAPYQTMPTEEAAAPTTSSAQ